MKGCREHRAVGTGKAACRWERTVSVAARIASRCADFFEVDAKHIILATLTALAREKQVGPDVLEKRSAIFGINPEKLNPAIS